MDRIYDFVGVTSEAASIVRFVVRIVAVSRVWNAVIAGPRREKQDSGRLDAV